MIKFNGLTENDLGIIVEEPTLVLGRAPILVETVEIDGKDGVDTEFLGYRNFNTSLTIQVIDNEKLDLILSTFQNEVEIEYQNRLTKAYITNAISVERMVFLKKFNVTISRHPFWFVVSDNFVNTSFNSGNIYSKPMIKLVKGTADYLDVSVSGIRFKYNFNGDSEVILDCENKSAIYNGLSRNRNLEIGWEFPILQPGVNLIVKHSGDAEVLFKRKDRWL